MHLFLYFLLSFELEREIHCALFYSSFFNRIFEVVLEKKGLQALPMIHPLSARFVCFDIR